MITYEVMVLAIQGDPIAASQVLDYFDAYIDRLSTHAYVDEGGHVTYGVDTMRKTQLQGKLLSAMLRFKL